jgi:integrase
MTLREAIELFKDHQKNGMRDKTRGSYGYLFRNLEALFGDSAIEDISSQDLYQFLLLLTEGRARSTARLRYAQLKPFFNFMIERTHASMTNPCNDPLLSKTFRAPRMKQREIIGREVIDEIIYRCQKVRDRLILELQARCGMRIGEVLGLRASDVNGRRLTIRRPKSGRDEESAFTPETLSGRLKTYLESRNALLDQRLFPICYSTARSMIKRLGDKNTAARPETPLGHLCEPEWDSTRGHLQNNSPSPGPQDDADVFGQDKRGRGSALDGSAPRKVTKIRPGPYRSGYKLQPYAWHSTRILGRQKALLAGESVARLLGLHYPGPALG